MLSLTPTQDQPLALIHEVQVDDQYLLNTIEGEWFEILSAFPWQSYREPAAAYYDALYAFNLEGSAPAAESECEGARERPEEAKQRLLFERVTMPTGGQRVGPILYQAPVGEAPPATVDPLLTRQ